ncbi:nurim homolog [Lingula anatina]|uniref:Nuclear envelope membrane protein n=1 Tax=Lingula anatina TaxID=7574 RepID=A0A1S3IQT7_LINAN|nr:nurim homolog [Lingula anatina]|eukprot:XP_013400433.2 nurim homolog [Lingula anatina]
MTVQFGSMAAFWFISILAVTYTVILTSQFVAFLSTQRGILLTEEEEPIFFPLLVDNLLMNLFFWQHTLLAQSWWKGLLHGWGLAVIDRTIYNVLTAVTLQVLMLLWQSPNYALWYIDTSESPTLWLFFFLIHLTAWALLIGATLTMDFLELIGVRQVYYYSVGTGPPEEHTSRSMQRLYKHMRHPGISCFLVILWLHPVMSYSRFILAVTFSLYLFLRFNVKEEDYFEAVETVDTWHEERRSQRQLRMSRVHAE